MTLRDRLSRIPEPELTGALDPIEPAIAASVDYLASDAALRSLEVDTYWPKWDSPWWHMVVLHELGLAHRIPARVVTRMVEGLDALPIHFFPLRLDELPPGTDPAVEISCHCALGCMYQVLTACGVDVARALPWVEAWFPRYQMADGGLNCDSDAYLVDECASSMVGTVAPLEAMLLGRVEDWSPARRAFVDRAAGFLVARELRLGSPSAHNAEERTSAIGWLKPCFPRLYLYDVIRGLAALVRWAEVTGGAFPETAVRVVVEHLATTFPDGVIRLQRRAYDGVGTRVKAPDGTWVRHPVASTFPLLDATSAIGRACPVTTAQWSRARRGLLALIDAGRVLPA
ncbi:MAG: hypothetical protein K8W52_08620 [Deltaproteobacteria bacterium]|nr:hypothetical protein [Deltaproteobacteria bacterium]